MLEAKQICVSRNQRQILNIPQLSIAPDQFTVILGHNGSGKSTLLKLLARQLKPDSGKIFLDHLAIDKYRQRILAQKLAYLPQRLPEVTGLSVTELVRLGRFAWRGSFGRLGKEDDAIVHAAMHDTDVAKYADHTTDKLSGGERQRAWIAMLLAQQAPLLLLDEPTSALDPAHQYEVMALLRRLNQQQQRGVLTILHDVNLAARYADRIIALKLGQLVFDGSPEQLLSPSVLNELYGVESHIIDHPSLNSKLAVIG